MGHKTTSLPLNRGDIIRVVTPGAGGYGDPKRRPVDQVLADVVEQKVSLLQAREQYGVAIMEQNGNYILDEDATKALRDSNGEV